MCWSCNINKLKAQIAKEPVWINPGGDAGMSWWEVNRVPDFYKDRKNKQ